MSWAGGVTLGFGALAILFGILVRAGKSRAFYPLYRTGAPPWVRNRAFGLLPGGVGFIAGGISIVLSDGGHHRVAAALVGLLFLPSLILAFVWMFRPPEFIKPQWLRDVESGAHPEEAPPVVEGTPGPDGKPRVYLPPVAYWGLWVSLGVVFVLWLLLDWPWGVLVGLGAGISTLAASSPRRSELPSLRATAETRLDPRRRGPARPRP